jgi:FkbM family methyltransferase
MSVFYDRLRGLVSSCENLGVKETVAILVKLQASRALRGRGEKRLFLQELGQAVHLRDDQSDINAFLQIFVHREYETKPAAHHSALVLAAEKIVSEGRRPLIIDCGANIGLASLWFAAQFPNAIVVAIEPDDANFEMLQRNVKNRPNIRSLHSAVWDQPAALEVVDPNAESWNVQVREAQPAPENTATASVRACTIPEIAKEVDGSELLIVKIDIEGAERFVFRSNMDWIATTPLLIIELHDWMLPWQGCGRAFFAAMSNRPFDFLLNGENLFCFNNMIASPLSDEP